MLYWPADGGVVINMILDYVFITDDGPVYDENVELSSEQELLFPDQEDLYNDDVETYPDGEIILPYEENGATDEELKEQLNRIEALLSGENDDFKEEQEEEISESLLDGFNGSEVIFDRPTDNSYYFSAQVDGATINDIFSIGLSIRNILLLFFLFFVCFKFLDKLKGIIYRIFNK